MLVRTMETFQLSWKEVEEILAEYLSTEAMNGEKGFEYDITRLTYGSDGIDLIFNNEVVK